MNTYCVEHEFNEAGDRLLAATIDSFTCRLLLATESDAVW
jgi:hypothetical protein